MFIKEERQSKERGKQLSIFSQLIALSFQLPFGADFPSPSPLNGFQNLPPTFLLLFTCLRSSLTLQIRPWKYFSLIKTSDLKQQQQRHIFLCTSVFTVPS